MNDEPGKRPRPPLTPLAYSVDAACALAGISDTTFYNEVAAGRLRAKKRGASTCVLRADLLHFIVTRAEGR